MLPGLGCWAALCCCCCFWLAADGELAAIRAGASEIAAELDSVCLLGSCIEPTKAWPLVVVVVVVISLLFALPLGAGEPFVVAESADDDGGDRLALRFAAAVVCGRRNLGGG